MDAVIQSFMAGFPVLISHFAVAAVMLVIGVSLYALMTPYDELKLVRGGNHAAALSLGGVILGLAIPLAAALSGSVNVYDIIVYGALAIVLQLLAYKVTDLILKDLPKRIQDGELSAAIVLVSIKLGVAAINAAAVAG